MRPGLAIGAALRTIDSMARGALQGRIDGIAVGAFVVGMVLWYFGGSSAIFDLLDAVPAVGVAVLIGVVAGVVATVALRGVGLKKAAGSGAILAFTLGLCLSSVIALMNQVLDGSKGRELSFSVKKIKRPSKGAPSLEVTLDGKPASLRLVDGCSEGSTGTAVIHDGALGFAWVGKIGCGQVAAAPAMP